MSKFNIVLVSEVGSNHAVLNPTFIAALQEKQDSSLGTIAILSRTTSPSPEVSNFPKIFTDSRLHLLMRDMKNARYIMSQPEGVLNPTLKEVLSVTDEDHRHGYMLNTSEELLNILKIYGCVNRDEVFLKLKWQPITFPKGIVGIFKRPPKIKNPYVAILREEWIEYYNDTVAGINDSNAIIKVIQDFFTQPGFSRCIKEIEAIKHILNDNSHSSFVKLLLIKKIAEDIHQFYLKKNIEEDYLKHFCDELREIFTETNIFSEKEPTYDYFDRHMQALCQQMIGRKLQAQNQVENSLAQLETLITPNASHINDLITSINLLKDACEQRQENDATLFLNELNASIKLAIEIVEKSRAHSKENEFENDIKLLTRSNNLILDYINKKPFDPQQYNESIGQIDITIADYKKRFNDNLEEFEAFKERWNTRKNILKYLALLTVAAVAATIILSVSLPGFAVVGLLFATFCFAIMPCVPLMLTAHSANLHDDRDERRQFKQEQFTLFKKQNTAYSLHCKVGEFTQNNFASRISSKT